MWKPGSRSVGYHTTKRHNFLVIMSLYAKTNLVDFLCTFLRFKLKCRYTPTANQTYLVLAPVKIGALFKLTHDEHDFTRNDACRINICMNAVCSIHIWGTTTANSWSWDGGGEGGIPHFRPDYYSISGSKVKESLKGQASHSAECACTVDTSIYV